MCEIAININIQQEYSEIDILGSAAAFVNLSKHVAEISYADTFHLRSSPSTYYPSSLRHVLFKLVSQSNGVVDAQVNGIELQVSGDTQAFRKLAGFLESLSELRSGQHFHLDWFAAEDLLAPATCTMSFVFSVDT